MNFLFSMRKMLATWFCLILLTMFFLAWAGGDGLFSYGQVVNDLEFSVTGAPRRSDLVFHINQFIEPLLLPVPEGEKKIQTFAIMQEQATREAFQKADVGFNNFRMRLSTMPQTPEWGKAKDVINILFHQIQASLKQIEPKIGGLKDVATRASTCEALREQVLILQVLAMKMPDPAEFLLPQLVYERKQYHARLRQFFFSIAFAILGLIAFSYFLFKYVLGPIKKLRLGAQRIAHGDYEHKLEIPHENELGELARMLNEMTQHFRESNDILERKVKERTRELNISGRLASVGFLAAGVAHEINNPILAINIAAESLEYRIAPLLDNLPPEDRDIVFEYLHMIQKESTRCQGITGRLLEFSRGSQSIEKQPVDLTLIVNEVVGMIRHLHKFADRKIIFEHHTPTIIQASAAEMKQVILNLVSNALEATDKGGTVQLQITESPQHVELTVNDNGCGMNEEVLEHLFDPFFTQRRDGKGTGLGLSITKRIIDDHQATITPSSQGPGQGSTFLLKFPKKLNVKKAG